MHIELEGLGGEKKANHKYLISYKYRLFSFEEGAGEKGSFFKVDLDDKSVIDRTKEYLEKMDPFKNAYKSETEIFKELINEDDSTNVVK